MRRVYDVLIVDDESLIRDGIKYLLSGHSDKYRIVAEASNGKEALEICRQTRADIVLTDIKMPVMDGFELIRALKSGFPSVKVILLSYHADFYYAKEAIKLGATDYILKIGLTGEDLLNVLEKAGASIVNDTERENEVNELKKQLDLNMEEIKGKFLKDILAGILRTDEMIRESILTLKLKLDEENLVCAIVDFCKDSSPDPYSPEKDLKLLEDPALSIIDEILGECGKGEVFKSEDSRFVLFLCFPGRKSAGSIDSGLKAILGNIRDCIRKYMSVDVTIGHSNIHTGYGKLADMYMEASKAISFKFYAGNGEILKFDGRRNFYGMDYKWSKEKRNHLMEMVKNTDKAGCASLIKGVLQELKARQIQADDVKNFCVDIVLDCNEAVKGWKGLEAGVDRKYHELFRMNDLRNLISYVSDIVLKTVDIMSDTGNTAMRSEIKRVVGYIGEHYQEELSVKFLADSVNLSMNYFGQLFKRETGENVVDYINKIRIRQAKKLLGNPQLKMEEISEKVGLSNVKYFHKVFFKLTGMTPKKYRESGS